MIAKPCIVPQDLVCSARTWSRNLGPFQSQCSHSPGIRQPRGLSKNEARPPTYGSRALTRQCAALVGSTRLLLLHEGFCTPRQLRRLDIFDMSGDEPMIADWIGHTRAAVSVELVRWLHQGS